MKREERGREFCYYFQTTVDDQLKDKIAPRIGAGPGPVVAKGSSLLKYGLSDCLTIIEVYLAVA